LDHLAGVDVGECGSPSAVAEAVLHDGGAEEHEHRPAAEHPRFTSLASYLGLIEYDWSSSLACC
jgi:hypothetical protein